jgi:hypothetical protein
MRRNLYFFTASCPQVSQVSQCCGMDADPVADPNSQGTYNEGGSCDGDPSTTVEKSDPAPWTGFWKDGKTPIHWEDNAAKGLQNCLSPGWHDRGTCNKDPNTP